MSQKAHLFSLSGWYCPVCDERNIVSECAVEMSKEDREEAFRLFYELEEWESLPESWEDIDISMVPNQVTCSKCGGEFETGT